jgi:hypothetical protein
MPPSGYTGTQIDKPLREKPASTAAASRCGNGGMILL